MIATKRLSSGKYIDLGSFTSSEVNVSDINTSLNYIYRFTGHHKNREPLTVAQHTILVMKLARQLFPGELEVEFDCLIHDFAESYLSDVATPLKRIFGEPFKIFEEEIEKVVYDALWLIPTPFTEEIKLKRKACDLLSLDIERRAMWDDQKGKNKWPEIPNEDAVSLKNKIALFEEIQANRFYDLNTEYINLVNKIRGSN